MSLPPGQRAVDGFPRFGTHMAYPPPRVLPDHEIAVGGAVAEPFSLPLAALADLPRREVAADFHCVAGWSATGLRWEGVPFARFFASVIEPALSPGAPITHVTFQGRDGYRSTACLEDVLADDVLIAEHLDGRPLDGDHGAPVRLVSPRQYGFISTKHLCRIEVHTAEPEARYHRNRAQPPGPAPGRAPRPGARVGGGAQRLPPGVGGARALPDADPADQGAGRPRRPPRR